MCCNAFCFACCSHVLALQTGLRTISLWGNVNTVYCQWDPLQASSWICVHCMIAFFYNVNRLLLFTLLSGVCATGEQGDCHIAVDIGAVKQDWIGCISWEISHPCCRLCSTTLNTDMWLSHWEQVPSERSNWRILSPYIRADYLWAQSTNCFWFYASFVFFLFR